jgi:hypothetical protein
MYAKENKRGPRSDKAKQKKAKSLVSKKKEYKENTGERERERVHGGW